MSETMRDEMTVASMELPGDLAPRLLRWYDCGHRDLPWRETPMPYYVWISEIMLQQTRVEAVLPYFNRFIKTLPNIRALAEAEEDVLLKLWEGLGYYRRAYNLQKAARVVMEQYGGEMPRSFEQLRGLPGIGDYTAGAVASIAYGEPKPAVDGNVLRVLARVAGDYRDVMKSGVKRDFSKALEALYPADRCGDFTQSLMELGAMVCLPNGAPRCGRCPLADVCGANLRHAVDELPVKTPKKPRKIQERTVFVLVRDGAVAVRKRPEEGLLAGLWELPNTDGHLDPEQAEEYLRSLGLTPERLEPDRDAKHIFTHIEWHMRAYRAVCRGTGAGLRWITAGQLERDISLPSAFRHWDIGAL